MLVEEFNHNFLATLSGRFGRTLFVGFLSKLFLVLKGFALEDACQLSNRSLVTLDG